MSSATESWVWIGLVVLALTEVVHRFVLCRLVWREVMRLFILFDLAMTKLVARVIKPRYEIRGSCDKRGVCCTQILGNPPRFVKRSFLLQWFANYHRIMHNFHVVARGPDQELIFRCGHLKTDGRCGIYRYRPRLCRNYPVLPFFEPPRLLPGCGYAVVPRRVGAMRAHPRLPILNPVAAVHHPTPPRRADGAPEEPTDYHRVDVGSGRRE